jgi:aldehyde dehydrogenase (NAD+)
MPRRAAGTPILPILTYSDLSEVMNLIKRRARSLAGYIFSRDRATIEYFVHSLSFGGGAVNQTNLQCFMTSSMPFGGVGSSGLGRTTANTDYSTP